MTDAGLPCPTCGAVHEREMATRESRILDPFGHPYTIRVEEDTIFSALGCAKVLYDQEIRKTMDAEPKLLELIMGLPDIYGPDGNKLTAEDGLTPEPEIVWTAPANTSPARLPEYTSRTSPRTRMTDGRADFEVASREAVLDRVGTKRAGPGHWFNPEWGFSLERSGHMPTQLPDNLDFWEPK